MILFIFFRSYIQIKCKFHLECVIPSECDAKFTPSYCRLYLLFVYIDYYFPLKSKSKKTNNSILYPIIWIQHYHSLIRCYENRVIIFKRKQSQIIMLKAYSWWFNIMGNVNFHYLRIKSIWWLFCVLFFRLFFSTKSQLSLNSPFSICLIHKMTK